MIQGRVLKLSNSNSCVGPKSPLLRAVTAKPRTHTSPVRPQVSCLVPGKDDRYSLNTEFKKLLEEVIRLKKMHYLGPQNRP